MNEKYTIKIKWEKNDHKNKIVKINYRDITKPILKSQELISLPVAG